MTTSYITTFRSSEPQRLANLLVVLDWLQTLALEQIVIVEQDRLPILDADTLPGGIQHIFCRNTGPFNKAWGMNVGARHAEGNVLIIGDADMIMDGDSLSIAVAACRGDHAAINPYRRMRDLSEAETQALVDHRLALDELPQAVSDTPNRTGIGEYVCFCGGIFVIKNTVYFDVGGMDERFVGWGGEDDAMSRKLVQLHPDVRELDRTTAFHLWHPRNPLLQYEHDHYPSNLALLETYRAADVQEMRNLADTTGRDIGNPDRYTTLDT